MPPRVSQKEIARAAGVHPTTVSLALRDSPRLPPETREKVQRLAKEMGYQPDPLLDALNAYRLAGRKRHFQGLIAWINCWSDMPRIFETGPFAPAFAAARAQCEANGFQLEEFRLGRGGYTASRLSTVLHERGIQGLIIPPVPGGRAHLNLRWDWFSVIAVGFSLARPEFHRVANDNFNNMRLLLRGVRHRGYRRPGLVILRHENLRTDTQRLAAFQIHGQPVSAKAGESVPPLLLDETMIDDCSAAVLKWYRRHQPDCILVHNAAAVAGFLRSAGLRVPEDVAVFSTVAQDQPGFAGVAEDLECVMVTAVQQLSGLLRRGETGLPQTPLRVLVTGRWTDGHAPASPAAASGRR